MSGPDKARDRSSMPLAARTYLTANHISNF